MTKQNKNRKSQATLELPEDTEVLADKGYCSQENEDALQDKKLVSRIMRKKQKNQELPPETRAFTLL
ncbi:MAG TPA: hypothetical protein PLD28_04510 [Candidatus Cloacimonas sp.]|nr:hypothetical protein [Candidatus Cloacimonas sp.]